MSFHFEKGWRVTFFEDDRRRSALHRRAFIHTDEQLMDFIQRAGGIDGSDTRFYVEQAIKRGHGDITLRLIEDQYQILRMRKTR